MTTINTTVAGIPCCARLTYFEPGQQGALLGTLGARIPHEDPLVEFEILDRNERSAPWLQRKVSWEEYQRIAAELLEAQAANEPDYCFEEAT